MILKLKDVQLLKKMNENYPSCHADYDEKYLYRALVAIFSKNEIKLLANTNSLKTIYGKKYKFLKGIGINFILLKTEPRI